MNKLSMPELARLLTMIGDKQWLKPYVHEPTARIVPLPTVPQEGSARWSQATGSPAPVFDINNFRAK